MKRSRYRLNDHIPVSTVLTPGERMSVAAAGQGLFRTLDRDTVAEAIQDIRANKSRAIIVSVACCSDSQIAPFATFIREFPNIPAIVLISEPDTATAQRMLLLGQSGVKKLIDLRKHTGWDDLRTAVQASGKQDIRGIAITELEVDLQGVPPDCWMFFESLFRSPSDITTVRELAAELNVLPSTLMSRFFRARLPAPKTYLSMARLVQAADLFENSGLSIANVSNHLDYSSPQSFGRHVRSVVRMPATRFRETYSGDTMLQRFRNELVIPYLPVLRVFQPLATSSGWYSRMPRNPWEGS